MINLKLLLNEIVFEPIDRIPPILYHATFKPLLLSIKKHKGLIPGGIEYRNFPWSEKGVYLSDNPDFAGSAIEDSETVPEEWLNKIILLSIDTKNLDIRKIYKDPQISLTPEEWNNPAMPHNYIYMGRIPLSAILKIEKGSYQW